MSHYSLNEQKTNKKLSEGDNSGASINFGQKAATDVQYLDLLLLLSLYAMDGQCAKMSVFVVPNFVVSAKM